MDTILVVLNLQPNLRNLQQLNLQKLHTPKTNSVKSGHWCIAVLVYWGIESLKNKLGENK